MLNKLVFSTAICSFVMSSSLEAIRSNGINTDKEYITFADEIEESPAVGFVITKFNTPNVGYLTGALTEKTTVITAAHGFNYLLDEYRLKGEDTRLIQPFRDYLKCKTSLIAEPYDEKYQEKLQAFYSIPVPQIVLPLKDVRVGFKKKVSLLPGDLYSSVSVTINPHYVESYFKKDGRDAIYDYAFLTLNSEPTDIKPIPLLEVARGKPTIGTFIGFGRGEFGGEGPVRRAAFIPDLDMCYAFQRNSPLSMVCSQFFEPLPAEKINDFLCGFGDDYDLAIRNQRWNKAKAPYGIGQEGDSGGPLLVNTGGEGRRIVGLVRGGGELIVLPTTEKKIEWISTTNPSKDEMYSKYYTGFTPLVSIDSYSTLMWDHVEQSMQAARVASSTEGS